MSLTGPADMSGLSLVSWRAARDRLSRVLQTHQRISENIAFHHTHLVMDVTFR